MVPVPVSLGNPAGNSGLATAGQRGARCCHPPVSLLQPVTAHHRRPLDAPVLRGRRLGRGAPPSPQHSCFPQEHLHDQHHGTGPYFLPGTARRQEGQVQIPSSPRPIYFLFHTLVLHLYKRKDIAASIHPTRRAPGCQQASASIPHPAWIRSQKSPARQKSWGTPEEVAPLCAAVATSSSKDLHPIVTVTLSIAASLPGLPLHKPGPCRSKLISGTAAAGAEQGPHPTAHRGFNPGFPPAPRQQR